MQVRKSPVYKRNTSRDDKRKHNGKNNCHKLKPPKKTENTKLTTKNENSWVEKSRHRQTRH